MYFEELVKFFDKMVKKRDFLKSYLPLATVLINSDFGFSFGAEDLSMAWKVRVKLATFSAIESDTLWNVDLSVGFAVAMVSEEIAENRMYSKST